MCQTHRGSKSVNLFLVCALRTAAKEETAFGQSHAAVLSQDDHCTSGQGPVTANCNLGMFQRHAKHEQRTAKLSKVGAGGGFKAHSMNASKNSETMAFRANATVLRSKRAVSEKQEEDWVASVLSTGVTAGHSAVQVDPIWRLQERLLQNRLTMT